MIRRLLRARLLASAAALLARLVLAPAAFAQGGTSAVAVNTRDGADVFRLAFHIARIASDTVDQTNAAVAYSSCDSCQTVAISIQALLYFGDPSVVTPENLAIAINEDCNLCRTLASAYQFGVGFGGPVHFTPEGNRRIAEVRRRLHGLRREDLTIEEIQARVDMLMDQFDDVLHTETVTAPAGAAPDEPGGRRGAPSGTLTPSEAAATAQVEPSATAAAAASPSPTPAATAIPDATPTPEASAAPTPEATATPDATPTPEPTATPAAPTPEATPTP